MARLRQRKLQRLGQRCVIFSYQNSQFTLSSNQHCACGNATLGQLLN
jgi:hypothetical protein